MIKSKNRLVQLSRLILPLLLLLGFLTHTPGAAATTFTLKRVTKAIDFQYFQSTDELVNSVDSNDAMGSVSDERSGSDSSRERYNVVNSRSLQLKDYSDMSEAMEETAASDNSFLIMYGGITSSFEYFLPVLIGTPPQMFTVQVDTGSASLAVPDATCQLYRTREHKTTCDCSASNIDGSFILADSKSGKVAMCVSNSSSSSSAGVSSSGMLSSMSGDVSSSSSQKGSIGGNSIGGSSMGEVSGNNNDQGSLSTRDALQDSSSTGILQETVPCAFSMTFGDKSFIEGVLVSDTVRLGEYEVESTRFGAIQKESLSFAQLDCPMVSMKENVRDGILGLSFPELDSNNGDNIFSKIVDKYKISDSFSMCLSKEGGLLTLGGITTTNPIFYTTIIERSYYSIHVEDVVVDNVSFLLKNQSYYSKSVVDSGTTLLYFHESIFNQFTKYLEEKYDRLPGFLGDVFWNNTCHLIEDDLIKHYPTISLKMRELDGTSFFIDIPPSLYMLKFGDVYCFGIGSMSMAGISVLIGDVALQGFKVHYDRGNNRIGFSELDKCESIYSTDNFTLSIVNGDNQHSQEGSNFPKPISLQLQSPHPEIPVHGVIISFTIVSGNAVFYPSMQETIRNLTNKDGHTSMMIRPNSFGKIEIQATVWDNKNNNTINFHLQARIKTWKIIVISLSSFVAFSIIAFLLGLIIYRRKTIAKRLALLSSKHYRNYRVFSESLFKPSEEKIEEFPTKSLFSGDQNYNMISDVNSEQSEQEVIL